MDILILVLFTFIAWLVHLGIVSTYINKFKSTKSATFRAVHSIDVALVVAVMLAFYDRMGFLATAATILATLAVLDSIIYIAFKTVRRQFNLVHFATAYTVVVLVVFLVQS